MIRNERQYRISKAQAQRFSNALVRIEQTYPEAGVHPLLRQAEREALQSQLESLRAEIAAYEDLRSGKERVFLSHSFDELPHYLIKARIASGLSQKDLAERLGMKEQQVQKYEATDYNSASLERVRAVIEALGVTVREDMSLPGE